MIAEARIHGDDSTRLLFLEEFEDLSSMSHLVTGSVEARIGDGYSMLCSRHCDCLRGTLYKREYGTVLSFVIFGGKRGRKDSVAWAQSQILGEFGRKSRIKRPIVCPSLWVLPCHPEQPTWWLSYLARLMFCLRIDVVKRKRYA